MGAKRENTLVVDFSVLPKRPDASVVQKFMYGKLKFNLSDAVNIQFHNVRNCVYVEMVDEATALRYHNAHHLQHTMECDKKEYKIPVYFEDGAVNVRVHDLPRQTPNAVIKEAMQPYGTILSINREVWKNYFPGVHNGVRVVRMRLEHHIPSYLQVDDDVTLITYRNQIKTCRFCEKKAHPRQKCSSSTNTTAGRSDDGDPALWSTIAGGKQQANGQNNEQSTEQAKETNKNTPQQESTDGNNGNVVSTDSESDEFITVTNKRRLSTKQKEDNASAKRVVSNQGCQNDGTAGTVSLMEETEDELSDPHSPVKTRSQLKKTGRKC